VAGTVKGGDLTRQTLPHSKMAGLPGNLFIELDQACRPTRDSSFLSTLGRHDMQINTSG
jgi:hypothetical protein